MSGVFVPGWAATPGLYAPGLPEGWIALAPPSFRATRGELAAYRNWLGAELAHRQAPVALAGHSMGAGLAVLAALDRPALVERLILLSPAGLPLSKSIPASLATFVGQVRRRRYPGRELSQAIAGMAAAPSAAFRLARTIHELDLTAELEQARELGIATTVIGCLGDELVTPEHSHRIAELLGARYLEVDAPEGHIWMIAEPERLARVLAS